MLALEVEYLMGRVVASTREDRQAVEWPPHPSRLFAALVAAYEECELGNDARTALEWLETLSAPVIYAKPPEHDGWVRDAHIVYVPPGDVVSKNLIPGGADGKERWFPAFSPQDPHVWFVWPDAIQADDHAPAIQHIAENVTYLGHSMSPVRVRVSDAPPKPTLVPSRNGTLMLRTAGKGRLAHLEEVHHVRKKNATIQPRLGRVASYRHVGKEDIPSSLFRHGYAFRRVAGPPLLLDMTAGLMERARKAVLKRFPDPLPEVISGHVTNGCESRDPHLAVTPLADVGHRYADGHVMGLGFWLPQGTAPVVIDAFEEAMADFLDLKLGAFGAWKVEPVDASLAARAAGLRLSTYTRHAEVWASVTPVIFGHFPDRSRKKRIFVDGEEKEIRVLAVSPRRRLKVIGELCKAIHLPAPVEVRVGSISALVGVPKASDFTPPARYANRFLAHVWIRFSGPVRGPMLLGAGRFIGFGFCRPLAQ